MDKKNGPSAPPPAEGEPERTKVARHRFAEGETRIMRLDEILRQRTTSEPTQTSAPALQTPAPMPVTAAAKPSGKLNAQEKQILASTEPAAHTVMVRREDLFARAQAERKATAPQPTAPPAQKPVAPTEERTRVAKPQVLAETVKASAAAPAQAKPATAEGAAAPPAAAKPGHTDTSTFGSETRVFTLDHVAKRGERDEEVAKAAGGKKASSEAAKAAAQPPPVVPPAAAPSKSDHDAASPTASRSKPHDLTPPPAFLPAGLRTAAAPVPPEAPAPAAQTPPPPPPAAPSASSIAAAVDKGAPSPTTESAAKQASEAAQAQVAQHQAVTPPATQRRIANQVTVVFAAKGGAGATSIAMTAAHSAALDKHSACVLDLDLQLGDALAAAGLPPRLSLAQTVQAIAEGQGVGKTLLPSHASGVHVVSQVGNLNDLEKITPEAVSNLVGGLRLAFEAIVIDGVRDFGDNALAVLDGADKVALVIVQEVLSVRRARWAYSILGKIGFEAEDITVVVNRFNAQSDISLTSVRQMFVGSPVVPVVSNYPLVTQSLDRGVPLRELKADASVSKSFVGCVEHLLYNIAPPTTPTPATQMIAPKRSLWQRIFGGGKQKSAS